MASNKALNSLVLAAFLLSMTQNSAAGSGSSTATDCQRFYPDDQTVDLNVSMELEERLVPMRIHESYLEDRWKRVQGATHGAILFRVRFDDFAPVRRDETPALRVNGKQAYYSFLLTDHVEMAELTAVMLSAASPTLKISAEELPRVQRNPADFGLVELEPLQREHRQKDVYVSYGGDGAIDAVAECNAPETARFPGCSVRFRAPAGVDVNMDFPIARLREWKRLKTSVEEFLNCARN